MPDLETPYMATPKQFASHADLKEKEVTFTRLSEHAYAYTAEGGLNTGIVVGDDAVLVADTQATPAMAQDVVRRIREITDKPIRYVVLTHYHTVRVLGASGFNPQEIISSQDTRDLIVERGEQNKASKIGRFPRLLRNVESIPRGLTWAIGGFIADVRASVEAGIAAGKDLHTVYKEILAKLKPKYGRWSSSTIAYPST